METVEEEGTTIISQSEQEEDQQQIKVDIDSVIFNKSLATRCEEVLNDQKYDEIHDLIRGLLSENEQLRVQVKELELSLEKQSSNREDEEDDDDDANTNLTKITIKNNEELPSIPKLPVSSSHQYPPKPVTKHTSLRAAQRLPSEDNNNEENKAKWKTQNFPFQFRSKIVEYTKKISDTNTVNGTNQNSNLLQTNTSSRVNTLKTSPRSKSPHRGVSPVRKATVPAKAYTMAKPVQQTVTTNSPQQRVVIFRKKTNSESQSDSQSTNKEGNEDSSNENIQNNQNVQNNSDAELKLPKTANGSESITTETISEISTQTQTIQTPKITLSRTKSTDDLVSSVSIPAARVLRRVSSDLGAKENLSIINESDNNSNNNSNNNNNNNNSENNNNDNNNNSNSNNNSNNNVINSNNLFVDEFMTKKVNVRIKKLVDDSDDSDVNSGSKSLESRTRGGSESNEASPKKTGTLPITSSPANSVTKERTKMGLNKNPSRSLVIPTESATKKTLLDVGKSTMKQKSSPKLSPRPTEKNLGSKRAEFSFKQSRRISTTAPSKEELKRIRALNKAMSQERKEQLEAWKSEQLAKKRAESLRLRVERQTEKERRKDEIKQKQKRNAEKRMNQLKPQSSKQKQQENQNASDEEENAGEEDEIQQIDSQLAEEIDVQLNVEVDFDSISLEDLDDLGTLGRGCFGRVKLVREKKSRRLFALKILNKRHQIENEQVEHVLNEKSILRSLDHPFIVKYYGCFQDSENLYILMERIVGIQFYELLQTVHTFTQEQTRFFAAQLVLILEYLHETHDVVYRDLKPENILVDQRGYLRLTDFGFAKAIPSGKTYTFCGTPCYMPPEVIEQAGYTKAVDWWALGVMIYEMLKGEPPLDNDDLLQLYDDILNIHPNLDLDTSLSDEAKDVITRFLNKNPEKRFGVVDQGVKDIKNHLFFRGLDWNALETMQINCPLEDIEMFQDHLEPYFEDDDVFGSSLTETEQNFFKDF